MLDTETKRRIDTARDILVGKVPDPKSQVEQITIALIYKFMDDMDAQIEELGGERSFFGGDFARYGWAKLMRAGLGGQETMNLYAEAIIKMPENPGIPQLFRDIFKNAFLPYRDPETLRMFLKVIDEFSYEHSERLGDAFEYLLSVLGSQGDAGQFRTPRHIIDFIVEIVDPKKDEKILDPACGTAGFLISAYKHVKENTGENGGSALTPEERKRLADNLKGYDISPDMVRLSLVNMYLHDLKDPHIFEYDTLTSEERWDDFADVILANPPFMSPKGGIRPHNRFSVQSKRSEVLFVDYMATHLTPAGRAGIIVPEGIIFQSQNAHRLLRKMLVEEYLVAVVSLPAGVFNPYAGVKTSVLILDRALARSTNNVAFFKIENDGYDLGAQRRPIESNDLPHVKSEIIEYLRRQRAGESLNGFESTLGLIVEKERIAENGEYNLSGEKYRVSDTRQTVWPRVEIGGVAEVFNGITSRKSEYKDSGRIKVIKVKDFDELGVYFDKNERGWIDTEINTPKYLQRGDTLMINAAHNASHVASKIGYLNIDPPTKSLPSGEITIFRAGNEIMPLFLNKLLLSQVMKSEFKSIVKGIHIYPKDIKAIQIPLPPLDVQKESVSEIEGYQKVIDGARAVVDNYRPHIAVDPEWPMVALGEVCTVVRGSSPRPKGDSRYYGGSIPRLMVADITRDGMYSTPKIDTLTEEGATKSRPMEKGDVIITVSGNPGLPTILAVDACIHDGFVGLRDLDENVKSAYLYWNLMFQHQVNSSQSVGAIFRNLTTHQVKGFKIPLPPLETQEAIVAELDIEQSMVESNRKLIDRFEKKIEAVIGRVWGEGD